MLIDSDSDEGIVIEGDEEELRDLIDTIEEAILDGIAGGALLDDDGVEQVVVRQVKYADKAG